VTRVLVRGIGDVGSTVAHLLHRQGFAVVIHDVSSPIWTRRKMAFTDAVFDGAALLEGILAVRVDGPLLVPARSDSISVSVHDFDELVQALRPDVLIDARMRKRQTPEAQIKLAKCTIGLGPNFVAQETTHFVIETGWVKTAAPSSLKARPHNNMARRVPWAGLASNAWSTRQRRAPSRATLTLATTLRPDSSWRISGRIR
jgi:hypothetical protein